MEETVKKVDTLYPDQREIHDTIVEYYRSFCDKEEQDDDDIFGDFDDDSDDDLAFLMGEAPVQLPPEPAEETPEEPWIKKLLIGYAGTGKTTTVAAIVESINDAGGNVVISAPTHKAVRVIKAKSGIKDVEFATIQKVLGVKAKKNYNTGELEFEPDYDAPFALNKNTLLIIDEVSMMNYNLFAYLVKSNCHFPILFVGDSVQIPPVDSGKKNEVSDSAVFIEKIRKEHHIEVHELREVRRQAAGNPIIKLATYIRDNYKKTIPPELYVQAVQKLDSPLHLTHSTSSNGGGEVDKALITKLFSSEEYKGNPDYCKVVAWRNESVRSYNQAIRKILYGESASEFENQYVIGEQILFEEPYGVKEFGRSIIIAQNSEEREVMNIQRGEVKIDVPYRDGKDIGARRQSIPVFLLSAIDRDTKRIHSFPVPKDVTAYKSILADVQKLAKDTFDKQKKKDVYKAMFTIQEAVAWVNYNYAVTAHKSLSFGSCKIPLIDWDLLKTYTLSASVMNAA